MKRTKYIILLCLTGIASALAFCACRTKPLNASVSSNDSVSTAERETGGSYFWESSYSQSEENGSNETSVSMESSSQSTEDFSSTESSSSYEESASSQESSSNTENLESSSEKDDTLHISHNFAPTGNKDATCEEQGENYFKCTVCGLEKTEYSPALGHKEKKVEGYPSTCKDEGLTDGLVCSVCDKVLVEQTPIAVVNHDIDEWYYVCKWCDFFDVSCLKFEKWDAAYQCTGFEKGAGYVRWLRIPDTYDGLPVVAIKYDAFKNHTEFVSIEIGTNISSIGENAFLGCENLVEVYDRSIKKVSEKAPSECGYLTQYAKRVQVGETNAFQTWVKKDSDGYIIYDENGDGVGEKVFIGYDGKETSLVIPEGITTIHSYAFSACNTVRSITLPKSLEWIEPHAFRNVPLLEKIIFQKTDGWQRRVGKSGEWKPYEGVFDNPTLAMQELAKENYYYYKRESE